MWPAPRPSAGAGDEDDQQADQGSPGLVAVADDEPQGFQVASVERQAGAGAPSSVGPGAQKTAPTVVLLGDQNPAGVPFVAGGPVHGRELLAGSLVGPPATGLVRDYAGTLWSGGEPLADWFAVRRWEVDRLHDALARRLAHRPWVGPTFPVAVVPEDRVSGVRRRAGATYWPTYDGVPGRRADQLRALVTRLPGPLPRLAAAELSAEVEAAWPPAATRDPVGGGSCRPRSWPEGVSQVLTAAAADVSRGLRGLFSPRLWHGVGRLALLYVSVVWFLYRLLTRVSAWFWLTHGRVPAGRLTTGRSAGPMNRRW